MRSAIAILLTLLVVAPAISQNYGTEIDRHVLVPCVRGMLAMRGQTESIDMPDSHVLQAAKMVLPPEAIDILHEDIGRAVAGKSYDARLALYRQFAAFCMAHSSGQTR